MWSFRPFRRHTYATIRFCLISLFLVSVDGFFHASQDPRRPSLQRRVDHRSDSIFRVPFVLFYGSQDDNDDDDEDIDLSGQDWRAFRAKLVMSEPDEATAADKAAAPVAEEDDLDGIGAAFQSQRSSLDEGTKAVEKTSASFNEMTPLDPSQWAYDSGKVIEKGAVILGGVEQDFGFGLRQQYFHKAAILVLDHDENMFTKGIILNRPSDLMLEEKWRVWFGGDVQGLNSNNPEIICLHSLKTEKVRNASVTVMNDIQWTSFDNAKRLVKSGLASPSDFWVFSGYAGWGPGQLASELDRQSWYMVSTDSNTLLKELARQSSGADPRDAGLDTWDLLMNMIGRGETAEECSGDFDDLILKEWARENLLSLEAGGSAEIQNVDNGAKQLLRADPIDKVMKQVSDAVRGEAIRAGSLIRACAKDRSPFLLENQEFHKAVILVINDDTNAFVGVILNRPAQGGLSLKISDKNTGLTNITEVPLRYGGPYAVKGADPLLWLHCDARLKEAKVGDEVGDGTSCVWKCTGDDASAAIASGIARPDDFIVVSGVSIWAKSGAQLGLGRSEVSNEYFELIKESATDNVWKKLLQQKSLTKLNLVRSVELANEAWEEGVDKSKAMSTDNAESVSIGGIGEGFDEEDDSLVFKSDVKVAKLSDDALRSWIATFLLGAPSLGVL